MSTQRCRLMLLVVLSAALLSNCFTIGGPARSFALVAARAAKIPRSIRAPFTNPQMMTARGFGKRSSPGSKFKELDAPWSFNKPSDAKFYNDLVADGDSLDEILNDSSTVESFPIDWLANEIAQNPAVVQAILRRFVDTNRDGMVTSQELMQHRFPVTSGGNAAGTASAVGSDAPEIY